MDKGKAVIIRLFVLSLVIGSLVGLNGQRVIIKADEYKHQFEGAGISFGLFLGHHYSMNDESQDEAIRLINKDINMKYLQDYIGIYPSDDPAYFDRRANYIKAAKEYRPDIQVSMVGNIFPDDLRHTTTVNGEDLEVLNTDDPMIYDRLANWYFELFEGFYERGVSVEILNVVNEPDLDRVFRKYHYGLDGDTKNAVAQIFQRAVPKFMAMLEDPQINTMGMEKPLIMGPSTISPDGCLEYIRFFKENYPEVWDMIDIVATHQYIGGAKKSILQIIANESEGKAYHQSETHAFKGDNLGDLGIEKPLQTTLSLAQLFGSAVTSGVEAWYYFENNYPDEFHPGGLIRVAWNAAKPIPYKHYYAFKQLTSAQPEFSHVVEHTKFSVVDFEVTTFRKFGQDTVYLHLSSFRENARNVTIEVLENGSKAKIKKINVRTTDNEYNDEITLDTSFTESVTSYQYNARGFSVNTLQIVLDNGITNTTNIDKDGPYKISSFDGMISVKCESGASKATLMVSDQVGRVVHKGSHEGHDYKIPTTNWQSGVYQVSVYTNGQLHTKSVYIQ